MTIDLARCTGCSACVTACYAENNIPTVGAYWQNATIFARRTPGLQHHARPRDELDSPRALLRGRRRRAVRRGLRDALRADAVPALRQRAVRAGLPGVRDVSRAGRTQRAGLQPLRRHALLLATTARTRFATSTGSATASRDRKQYAFPEPLNWQLNPDVTVRGKGVMEKCTFCVQRIREAENRATLEHRDAAAGRVHDGVRAGLSVARHHVRRRGRSELVGRAARARPARVPRVRRAQHLHRGGLLEEGQPSGAGARRRRGELGGADMATTATPRPERHSGRTFASAAVALPGGQDYEQVDDEIVGTLQPDARLVRGARHRDPLPAHRRVGVDVPDSRGPRRRRLPAAGDVGRVHHHLRVLGRYRPRRHADLGDSLSVPRRIPHDDLSRVAKR